jgi:hypothetical protein
MPENPIGHVSIVGRDDPPPWTDIAAKIEWASLMGLTRYSVLEAGMTSGRSSIAIAFPLDGERWVGVQTSLSVLEAVVAAAHGAEQRWAGE